ncbi:MAG: Nre family DNA repair protein [Candidatus Micrarchaeia archaeon]
MESEFEEYLYNNKFNLKIKRSDIIYKHMKDPALLKYYYKTKTTLALYNKNNSIEGSSPTDIFVGRYNYPYVYIGPLVPPEFGDTSLLGTPEKWRNLSIEEIINMRTKLIRGMSLTNIYDVEKGKLQQQIQELAMAERYEDTSLSYSKKPTVKLELNDDSQPFGPSVQIDKMEVPNIKTNKKIENLFFDYDARAEDAVIELYNKDVEVSKIQKAFSAGIFGIKKYRKFVPTRWSITAVDDTLSKYNRENIKSYGQIDAIYTYFYNALDNRWLIFFIPGNWQYETIEAWWPKTIWNETGKEVSIYSSYEAYEGRKKYAEIGGCYYAARLAVTEKLKKLNKQAIVLILREIHEGYTLPVGVWNVREHVRETLTKEPIIINSVAEMKDIIKSKLDIKPNEWIKNSVLLKFLYQQRKLNL